MAVRDVLRSAEKSVSPRFRLREIRILVRVRRRAAAEKAQRLSSHDRVPRAWRDENRIAPADRVMFTIELYLARAFQDEIKLLRHLVIVRLCPASCGDARFRKALVCTGALVRSRIERIVEPSFVIKGGWAERFWTVIIFKDAAMRRATEGQVSLATAEIIVSANQGCCLAASSTSFSAPPWRLRPVAVSSEPRCWLSPVAVPCASDSLSEICRP